MENQNAWSARLVILALIIILAVMPVSAFPTQLF